jgi:hypothetical protein
MHGADVSHAHTRVQVKRVQGHVEAADPGREKERRAKEAEEMLRTRCACRVGSGISCIGRSEQRAGMGRGPPTPSMPRPALPGYPTRATAPALPLSNPHSAFTAFKEPVSLTLSHPLSSPLTGPTWIHGRPARTRAWAAAAAGGVGLSSTRAS